jgi:hypothetical protein
LVGRLCCDCCCAEYAEKNNTTGENAMQTTAFYLFFILGLVALLGTLWKMSNGISVMNLRAIALIVIGTFVALLAIAIPESFNASFGILGVIIGYLFGTSGSKSNISGSKIENSNIAGRDINQRIDELKTDVTNIEKLMTTMINESKQESQTVFTSVSWHWESKEKDYHFIKPKDNDDLLIQWFETILNHPEFTRDFHLLRRRFEKKGWKIIRVDAMDNSNAGMYFKLQVIKDCTALHPDS